MPDAVQIDPQTGERIQSNAPQIDPATGERISAAPSKKTGPLDRTFGNYASEITSGVGRGLWNDVTGIYGALRHPFDTAQAVKDQSTAAVDAAQKDWQSKADSGIPLWQRAVSAGLTGLDQAPMVGGMVQRAESGDGVASPESAGAASEAATTFLAPAAAMKIPVGEIVRRGAEHLTGTSPSLLTQSEIKLPLTDKTIRPPGLVPKTQAANAEIAKTNAGAATDHLNATQDALQTTQGNELNYKNELQTKAADLAQADAAKAGEMSRKHADAVKKAQDAAEQARADADAETDAEQRKYFQGKAEHQQNIANAELQNKTAIDQHQLNLKQHEELQSGLNETDKQSKVGLKAVEDRVHSDANQLYEDLKPKLAKVEADPETTAGLVDDMRDKVQPATGEPPLLAKFAKLAEHQMGEVSKTGRVDADTGEESVGHMMTYADYDNFRSAIGRELRKGTLNPDHYHIYDTMLNGEEDPMTGERSGGIVDEMKRMADTQGLSEEADAARTAWRNWAQAFRDRKSPLRKILTNPEQHGAIRAMAGKQSYLDRLRSFGPDGAELADRMESGINTAQQHKATFPTYGGIKVPAPKSPPLVEVPGFNQQPPIPKTAQVNPPPPAPPLQLTAGSPLERAQQTVAQPVRAPFPDRPVETPMQTITPGDIKQVKLQALQSRAFRVGTAAGAAATTLGIYRSLSNAMHGNLAGAVTLGGEATLGLGLGYTITKMLDNPLTRKALTNPTARDVAAIPTDLARDMGPVIEAAKAKGIKVSPALLTAVSAASSSRWYNQDQ